MNLEGLEMIAVLVVVVLFVKVLEQFGLLEASYDGKQEMHLELIVTVDYVVFCCKQQAGFYRHGVV